MTRLTTLDPKSRSPHPLLIVMVLMVLAAGWFALIRPIEQRASDALAARDQVSASLEANQQRLSNLETGRPDELEPLIEVWRGAGVILPLSSQAQAVAIEAIDQITEVGARVGVLVEIRPLSDGAVGFPVEKRLQGVELSLTVEGALDGFAAFLTAVEDLEPLMVVNAVEIKTSVGGGTMSVNLFVMTTAVPLTGQVPTIGSRGSTTTSTAPSTTPSTTTGN